MCTTIAQKAAISGSGKGPAGWFPLAEAYIAYDHPFHARLEHALCLDFVNEAAGQRVAVELSRASARDLAQRLLAALDEADAYERGDRSATPG
jgi:hypothetical protein